MTWLPRLPRTSSQESLAGAADAAAADVDAALPLENFLQACRSSLRQQEEERCLAVSVAAAVV